MSFSGRRGGFSKFLIIDSEPHVVRALRSAVEAAGSSALVALTVAEGRKALHGGHFVAVIVEASLPDGSGLDLLEELRHVHAHLPALVTSSAVDAAVANRAHLLRASCVFKPDIVPNVRAFVERAIASSGETVRRTQAAAHEVSTTYWLTGRERELVELIALGVPRDSLAGELGVSENTLKTLIRHVLVKCNETRIEGVVRVLLDQVLSLSCSPASI